MPGKIYNSFMDDLARGLIDLDGDSFKCVLTTSAYTPDIDTHTTRADVTNEVVGAGYSAGGVAVTVSVTKDVANDRVDVTLGGFTLDPATITARRAVYFRSQGAAASNDRLVAVIEFPADVTSSGAAWTLTPSTLRFQNTAI